MPYQSRRGGMPVKQMQYANPGTRGFVELTTESLEALADYVAWTENVATHKLPRADNYLAMFCAMLSGSYAQKYSAGMKRRPEDTTRSWKMPVPRVTNRYFLGWKVMKLRNAVWLMTNTSREAYYIEYGIHRNPATGQPSPRRIRRPVFKLSYLETMHTLKNSRLQHRIWQDVLVPKSGEPGRRTRNLTWSTQPSGVMGEIPEFIGHVAGPGGGLAGRHPNMRPIFKSIARNQRKLNRRQR